MSSSQWRLLGFILVSFLAVPAAHARKPEPVKTCVWRITNAKAPFYLVGTIHALSSSDYPLPKAFEQALHDSQQLFFEIAPSDKSDFSEKFARAALYPKGDVIQHHVHPQTWAFLAKNFQISNYFNGGARWQFSDVRFDSVEQLRPWAIAYYVWGIHGYSDIFSRFGVDNHLAYQAKRMGKATGGLETDEEHINVLKGMNDIESELILLHTLVRGDKRKQDFEKLRKAWRNGDTDTIWAIEQDERSENPGGDVRLLDQRNVRWIPKIKWAIQSGKPTAIVVGCGHYPGPNGLLALLRKQGFQIEQL